MLSKVEGGSKMMFNHLLRKWKTIWNDESGMGVVEVILIIIAVKIIDLIKLNKKIQYSIIKCFKYFKSRILYML